MAINRQTFSAITRNEIRKENEGVLTGPVVLFKGEYCSFLFIVKYISADAVQTLKSPRVNCLNISGNCYIQTRDFPVYVSGQRVQRKQRTSQAKAFQESVIELLFQLLSDPDSLRLSYQELVELANTSIGSVNSIIVELEGEHSILGTKAERVLKNKPDSLERWIIAYHDILRPRLLKRQMRFLEKKR